MSLNSHQFQINKIDSPECSCGHIKEDIRHYVLFCPNYDAQRNELYQNASLILGTNFGDYPTDSKLNILIHGDTLRSEDDQRMAFHFQKFLLRSKRFKL